MRPTGREGKMQHSKHDEANTPEAPCRERSCRLDGRYVICLEAEDAITLFAGLRCVAEEAQPTAHLRLGEKQSGAWICLEDPAPLEELRARVAAVPEETHHWIRMRVEDQKEERVLFDVMFGTAGADVARSA
jgi:hypothetical protein